MSKLEAHKSELFLELHKSLILYTNEKENICKQIKTIDDIGKFSTIKEIGEGIVSIRNIMYEESNLKQYCRDNPNEFKEQELSHILKWKYKFIGKGYVIKHLSQYSVLQIENNDSQLYGFIGITDDVERHVPSFSLPYYANIILLPFMGQIIYDGFISGYNIHFGGNIKKRLNSEYNRSRALRGIYFEYEDGDDLENPPAVSPLKDQITFSITQSLKHGEYPSRALDLATSHNQRHIFESVYTKKYLPEIKKWVKNNGLETSMHYAIYRESVIAIMPTKKEVENFCTKHYPSIINYITYFKNTVAK